MLAAASAGQRVRISTYGPCTFDVAKEDWLEPANARECSEHEVMVFKRREEKRI